MPSACSLVMVFLMRNALFRIIRILKHLWHYLNELTLYHLRIQHLSHCHTCNLSVTVSHTLSRKRSFRQKQTWILPPWSPIWLSLGLPRSRCLGWASRGASCWNLRGGTSPGSTVTIRWYDNTWTLMAEDISETHQSWVIIAQWIGYQVLALSVNRETTLLTRLSSHATFLRLRDIAN